MYLFCGESRFVVIQIYQHFLGEHGYTIATSVDASTLSVVFLEKVNSAQYLSNTSKTAGNHKWCSSPPSSFFPPLPLSRNKHNLCCIDNVTISGAHWWVSLLGSKCVRRRSRHCENYDRRWEHNESNLLLQCVFSCFNRSSKLYEKHVLLLCSVENAKWFASMIDQCTKFQ